MSLTSCSSTAHSAIARVVSVASNVPHSRIVETLVLELPAIHVLYSPEASCCYSDALRAGGYIHGSGGGV